MELRTFMFSWRGRRRFIDAETQAVAEMEFMERYGFWPEGVEISDVTGIVAEI